MIGASPAAAEAIELQRASMVSIAGAAQRKAELMENIGTFSKEGDDFTFRCPTAGVMVRGKYPEWVLEAAAEAISVAERIKADGRIEEISALVEFEEASDIDLDIAKMDHNQRFEAVPQCFVAMNGGDYRWVSPGARKEDEHALTRIFDMSRTHNDTFLQDEPVSA